MLDKIIQYEALREITKNEWRQLKVEYSQQKNVENKKTFIKTLALHSGVSKKALENFFEKKSSSSLMQILYNEQQSATKRIDAFLKRTVVKNINVVLPRSILNQLIAMIGDKGKRALRAAYFYRTLSQITRFRFSDLVAGFKEHLLSRDTPARATLSENKKRAIKRQRQNFSRSHDVSNSFIIDDSVDLPVWLGSTKKMTTLGVSVVRLLPVTPEKKSDIKDGSLKKTPGGTRADMRYNLDSAQGSFAFYQRRLRPPIAFCLDDEQLSTQPNTRKRKQLLLPKAEPISLPKAKPIQFTATRDSLKQQQGVRRHGCGRAIMGISAFEVFKAHGLTEWGDNPNQMHWSHLIAHFLADEVDLKSPIKSSKPLVNLVPTTASSNYATLAVVELRIKALLSEKKTDSVDILVTPVYEHSNIPSELIYQLTYQIKSMQRPIDEKFIIYPRSKANCSPRELKSINVARNHMFDGPDELDDSLGPFRLE